MIQTVRYCYQKNIVHGEATADILIRIIRSTARFKPFFNLPGVDMQEKIFQDVYLLTSSKHVQNSRNSINQNPLALSSSKKSNFISNIFLL